MDTAGNVWAGLADTYGVHRRLFIVSYVASSLLRFSLSLAGSFPLIFAIMVATEITSSPVPVLMDASVMVASQVGFRAVEGAAICIVCGAQG